MKYGYIDLRRTTANARERKRMHSLNAALDRLRSLLPVDIRGLGHQHKLSKIETLRAACNYISVLTEALQSGVPLCPTVLKKRLSEGLSQTTANLIAKTLIVSDEEHVKIPDNNDYCEKHNVKQVYHQNYVISNEGFSRDNSLSNTRNNNSQYLLPPIEQEDYCDFNFVVYQGSFH